MNGAWARSPPPFSANWTPDDFVQQILNSGPRAERVLIANVGGQRMGELAQAAISTTWHIEPRFVHSAGGAGRAFGNAYPEPAKLGVDRWDVPARWAGA